MHKKNSRNVEVASQIYSLLVRGTQECKQIVKDIGHPVDLDTQTVDEFIDEVMRETDAPLKINKQPGEGPWIVDQDGFIVLWQKHEILTILSDDGVDTEECLISFFIMKDFSIGIKLIIGGDTLGVVMLLAGELYRAKKAIQEEAPWLKD